MKILILALVCLAACSGVPEEPTGHSDEAQTINDPNNPDPCPLASTKSVSPHPISGDICSDDYGNPAPVRCAMCSESRSACLGTCHSSSRTCDFYNHNNTCKGPIFHDPSRICKPDISA